MESWKIKNTKYEEDKKNGGGTSPAPMVRTSFSGGSISAHRARQHVDTEEEEESEVEKLIPAKKQKKEPTPASVRR
jgi:hypothetical protein